MGWGVLALALWHGLATEAAAADHGGPTESTDTDASTEVLVVAVVERGNAEETQRAIDAFVAHLAGTRARLIIERPAVHGLRRQIAWARRAAKRHGAAGVFWLDVAPNEELVLYLVEPQGKSALLRAIPRDPQSDAATFEALGTISRSITTSLLEGAEIGMRPIELDEPEGEPTPAPAPPPRSWPRLRLALSYVGANFSSAIKWQHGLGVDAVVRPIPALLVGAGYAFMFPARIDDDFVALQIQRNPIHVAIGYHGRFARTFAAEVEPRLTIDPLRHTIVELKDASLDAEEPKQRVLASAGVSARLLWYVWHNLSLYVSGTVDVVLNPFNYVVLVDGNPQTSVSPHRVRGELNVGMAFGLLDRPGKRAVR